MADPIDIQFEVALSALDGIRQKLQVPVEALDRIRENYRKRADPRFNQINDTPFAPASLARGRIPGEFSEKTGLLRQQTVNDFEQQGFTYIFGPTVAYAQYQDAILRRKGPFAPDAGLIPYTPDDLTQDAETVASWLIEGVDP